MRAHEVTAKARRNRASIWPVITVLGIASYVAIDIILTFLRPDYSWLHNSESDYGRGLYFWLMDINFLLRCFFSLALVRAIIVRFPNNTAIKRASAWIIVWAAGSGLLTFFADNPEGYPKLWSGGLHLVIAFVAFIAALVAMIVFRRLIPAMGLGKFAAFNQTALTGVALVSLILLGHSGFRPHSLGGLYERIFLAAVLTWEAVLALSAKTISRADADNQ